ncbi:hypothetical protein IW261DRAFT_454420 [Armillaria novae-zelandiae]|uniref:Uncharacterized protein n=1 Tax=Armillaria novae-zelandiae TaxID=153914 RepID=A0AA39P1B2_9AGAR|nr:hypothetical protein IW261DRAFT_454420 [Armillaria novae-zelandiae]
MFSGLHRGRGRSILSQQRIHASVMFQHKGYTPSATFLGENERDWASLFEIDDITNVEDLSWADEWAYMLDMDLFDDSMVRNTIRQLKSDAFLDPVLLQRLAFMALSGRCAKEIAEAIDKLVALLSEDMPTDIQVRKTPEHPSSLILEPGTEQTGCHASSTASYVSKAQEILTNNRSRSQCITGLSCLARLAKTGRRHEKCSLLL